MARRVTEQGIALLVAMEGNDAAWKNHHELMFQLHLGNSFLSYNIFSWIHPIVQKELSVNTCVKMLR